MLMYSHSPERNRVDVVDLDPYGTAAPFIDAGVQCITDGGMLFPPALNPY
jgi:tRNA (guanine26-N2/guanine27-N2)-dimethyltransferase